MEDRPETRNRVWHGTRAIILRGRLGCKYRKAARMKTKTYKDIAIQRAVMAVVYVAILLLAGEFRWGTSAMIIFVNSWIAQTAWEIWRLRRARIPQDTSAG